MVTTLVASPASWFKVLNISLYLSNPPLTILIKLATKFSFEHLRLPFIHKSMAESDNLIEPTHQVKEHFYDKEGD